MINKIENNKVGIDIHGVINTHPVIFEKLTKKLKTLGYEIHILTGPRLNCPYKTKFGNFNSVYEELDKHNIVYDELFSVLDYNIEIGIDVWENDNGWWTSEELWNKTKSIYCKENSIGLHIDDTKIYGKYFETPFAHITPFMNSNCPRIIELFNISKNSDIIKIIKSVSGFEFVYKEISFH